MIVFFCFANFVFGFFWFAKILIFISPFLNITSYVFVLPGYVCGLMFSLEFHEILWYI